MHPTEDIIDASSPCDEPIEPTSLTYRITEKPKPPETPLLNRTQRRQLGRYIRHKAALQVRHVLATRRKMTEKLTKQAKAFAKLAKQQTKETL